MKTWHALCCLLVTHFRKKRPTQTEIEGMEKVFQANGQEKKAGVAIIILAKIDIKTKAIKRDTEGQLIILKGRIHKDINIVNTYAPNTGAPPNI